MTKSVARVLLIIPISLVPVVIAHPYTVAQYRRGQRPASRMFSSAIAATVVLGYQTKIEIEKIPTNKKSDLNYDLGAFDRLKVSLSICKTNAGMPGDEGLNRARYEV